VRGLEKPGEMMGTWGFCPGKWGDFAEEMESSPGGSTMAFPHEKKGECQISDDWTVLPWILDVCVSNFK
jgi:hypothetical protein